MAEGDHEYQSPEAQTQLIDASSTVPDGDAELSSEYANEGSTKQFTHAAFRALFTFGIAPGEGKSLKCWFIKDLNSNDYEDGAGGGTPTIPARPPDFFIPVRNVTSAQEVAVDRVGHVLIRLPNCDFKLLVFNDCGQTISTGTLDVFMRPYKLRSEPAA